MENVIMHTNKKKYHQTEGCGQLQKGELLRDIGTMGTGPKTSKILDGTYRIPSGTTAITKKFISQMKCADNFNSVPPVTFKEFCEGWRCAKEKTSSTGPHFGHYKAGIKHGKIGRMLFQRSQIPMLTGYSPIRHRRGVDVMLLKKEQNYDVDNLRTIVLFDSEANMNNKHTGRRGMKAAITQHQIATEQYSRNHRKAIDHALNRRLVMDHQRYLRQPFAIASCDLKSCYDRINHSSAGLALRKIGISQQEVMSMFTTIQQMTHKVRTAFGDSAKSYGGQQTYKKKWRLPPQGVLQGNGCGPAIWSILSSNLFHILRDKGHRNKFISFLRKLVLELAGFAYVDDTDLLQTDTFVEAVVQQMQRKLQLWQEAVGVTGGILSPHKCWWYLVQFQYKKGKWEALAPTTEAQVWIQNEKRQNIPLRRVDPSVGINMLGVHIAPDGNNKDHVHSLRKKAEKWAALMSDCNANKDEVWTALHRTIPFSIGYSLPAVTLTPTDCQYIMAPVNKVGLSRSGIPSTIPSAIRNGPIQIGGLGILDPYIRMGTSQIETLITNTWLKTPTGILLEIALDDIILEMGVTTALTPTNIEVGLKYACTHSWIRHVLQFAVDFNIAVDLGPTTFQQPREYDNAIMESAIRYTSDKGILQSLNKVRMELRVVWLSDITTANGRQIDPRCINRKTQFPLRNDYRWPQAHHTTTQDWARWRQWISTISDQNHMLISPLGRWHCAPEGWVDKWDCLVTDDDEMLYVKTRDNQMWKRHIIQRRRNLRSTRYYLDFLLCHQIRELPGTLKRATIRYHRTYIELLATGSNHTNLLPAPSQTMFTAPLTATKEAILDMINQTLQPEFLVASDNLDILFHDFSQGTTIAVSDGSYYPDQKRASGAWIIESTCRSQWIMGSMTCIGTSETFSSYRSELMGLVGISVTTRVLANCLPQPAHYLIGCDGLAALNTITLKTEDISAKLSNWDLISILHDIWISLTLKPVPVHIKGHQDMRGRPLNRLEQMNILMDRLAKMTASTYPPREKNWTIAGVGIRRVMVNTEPVVDSVSKRLYNHITSQKLKLYVRERIVSNPTIIPTISWSAFQYARERAPTKLNIFMSKWISNTVATGTVLQRRRHRIFNRCPLCNAWGEDRMHVLVCWDIRAKMIWQKGLNNMQDLMVKEHTHPEIVTFILDGLRHFHRAPRTQNVPQDISVWKREQLNIGWLHMLSGFISEEVVTIQSGYYNQLGSRKGGKQWAGKIILQCWTMIRNMWAGRNEILHQKEIINSISGEALLDIEIEREYDLGCENLPQSVRKWYRPTKAQILSESITYKKGWLLIIRTVKESLAIADYSIFTSSRALRRWVGLSRG
jgi:hypothetical protein